jgi:hypothetical protein
MRVDVELMGTTSLIMNKFHDAAAEAATNGTRTSFATADRGTPFEIAEAKIYLGLKGKPMIPQPNLLRCIVNGGKFHKIGKSQVTTEKKSMLYACIDIEGAEIPLIHEQPWRVDTRAVVIPSTGGRILTHRPMFDDWKLKFVLMIDTELMSPKLMRAIVDDAGKRIGLGDFRPDKKGPYGRFVVTLWREHSEKPNVSMREAAREAAE